MSKGILKLTILLLVAIALFGCDRSKLTHIDGEVYYQAFDELIAKTTGTQEKVRLLLRVRANDDYQPASGDSVIVQFRIENEVLIPSAVFALNDVMSSDSGPTLVGVCKGNAQGSLELSVGLSLEVKPAELESAKYEANQTKLGRAYFELLNGRLYFKHFEVFEVIDRQPTMFK